MLPEKEGESMGSFCKQLLVLSGCDGLQRWRNLILSQIMPRKYRGSVRPEEIPVWSLKTAHDKRKPSAAFSKEEKLQIQKKLLTL